MSYSRQKIRVCYSQCKEMKNKYMVANTDIQIWQDAVQGINDSGQTALTHEEWAALATLNDCLSSGNFSSDESRHSYQVLNESQNRHGNNPLLQTHLYNFVALCYKYATMQQSPTTSSGNIQIAQVDQITSTELEEKVICPKCGSKQIQVVKKGYNSTKGCCGYALCGPLGFLFGQHKANEVERFCIKCAHKW